MVIGPDPNPPRRVAGFEGEDELFFEREQVGPDERDHRALSGEDARDAVSIRTRSGAWS